jgi:uncharacterized protein (UPF0335 family)
MTAEPGDGLILSLVQRIEALEEQIKDLNSDKSEVYKEAKGQGFDIAILKKLVAERRRPADERAEEGAILEIYRAAVARAESEPRARAHVRAA